ncbi:MAG: InlB B-repeat-containing protein [Firmicutes bacterium]|nr:InlB B-repeat-containing protein [Bacillota bacterium]
MKTGNKEERSVRVIALCLSVLAAVLIWLVVFVIHPVHSYGEEAQYKLNFNANGGTTPVSSKTVVNGEPYGELPEAVRTGYLFLGWYTSLGTDGVQEDAATVADLTRDRNLYARWTPEDENAKTYKVYFQGNGGKVAEEFREVKNGEAYGELPEATREGYFFLGWFTKYRTGTQVVESTRVNLTKNQYLYAHWEEKPWKTEISLQIGNPEITINGKTGPIDEQGTAPVIRNNRTLLPVRAVIEALGGTVSWNEAKRQVSLKMKNKTLYLQIDSTRIWDNKKNEWEMDTAPVIENGRTLLPIRAVTEYFGAAVNWEEASRTVTIRL